ncbi:hypothetical protein BASA62_009045 [Batrachochytrium salamandrivorans]|nr:hypothetical protein BASA62_009045 [Batrachochytrium salamandrivorans]
MQALSRRGCQGRYRGRLAQRPCWLFNPVRCLQYTTGETKSKTSDASSVLDKTDSLSNAPKVFPSCILSGIQPTGIPHIVPQDAAKLRTSVRDLACALLACGICPEASSLFRQSRVHQHTELGWLLFCRTPVSWVSRMHQWKTKLHLAPDSDTAMSVSDASHAGTTHLASDISAMASVTQGDRADHGDNNSSELSSNLNVGLLSYPILQAADILLYRATHVPVGDDQAQHLNLSTMIARSFNSHYNKNVFSIPQSIIPSTGKRIMSLRSPTSKMSKSDPVEQARINIDDSADQIRSKIRRATTDSLRGISYSPKDRPGVTNLLHMWMALETSTGIQWSHLDEDQLMAEVIKQFGSHSNEAFKAVVTDVLVQHLGPIHSEIIRLRKDPAYLDRVLEKGEMEASLRAERTMKVVRRTVGLL